MTTSRLYQTSIGWTNKAGLENIPTVEKKMCCTNCEKEFEIVGSQGNEKEMRTIVVSCPYDDCGRLIEVMWPKNQQASVGKIPREM
jgi:hypothetical protein